MEPYQKMGQPSEQPGLAVSEKGRARDTLTIAIASSAGLQNAEPTNGLAPLLKTRSHSFETGSILSADGFHELRLAHSLEDLDTIGRRRSDIQEEIDIPTSKIPPISSRWRQFWDRNLGLFLVLVAQMFGMLMNITTRTLELEGNRGKGLHPFQIIFARMSITSVLSVLYMWYKQIPDFPFGAKGVRALLVARGIGGFFGVTGLYWSLQYLPLSDATVLTFLAPIIACYACSKIISEPFTRTEQIGGFVSLLGVVLIARPTYLFSSSSNDAATQPTPDDATNSPLPPSNPSTATDAQRLAAVGMAMVGVCGAACAYTTIRWIGRRAHPLISVTYFATWSTFVTAFALAFVPSIPFVLPATPKEWLLLLFIGVTGFAMQFLLTAGLRYEKSSRATNMVYSQMLFALAGDKLVFGISPGVWSLAGSALILGSAIVVAVQKESSLRTMGRGNEIGQGAGGVGGERQQREERGTQDEETGLFEIGDVDIDEEEHTRQLPIEMEMLEHRETSESVPVLQADQVREDAIADLVVTNATTAVQEAATQGSTRDSTSTAADEKYIQQKTTP